MDWRTQVVWIGWSALGLIVLIVVAARIWRLFGRDLELDAKRASRAITVSGLLLLAISATVDLYGILLGGIGILLLLAARLLSSLSESARLDKYQVEEES